MGPRRVERVSGAYWSGFLLVRGNTVAPCLQCSEWTEDPIVPASLFLCRWDMRAPADRRRTDGRTDRVSLPFCFDSLSSLSSRPVPSRSSLFSLRVELSTHPSLPFSTAFDTSFLPYFPFVSAPFRFLCQFSSSRHEQLCLPFSLFFQYFSIPHVACFFFFFRFSVSLFFFLVLSLFLNDSTIFVPLFLVPPFLFVLYVQLAWHAIFLLLHSPFIARSFVAHCYQLTPTLVLPLMFPEFFQEAAPVSAFCSRVSRTQKKRENGRE